MREFISTSKLCVLFALIFLAQLPELARADPFTPNGSSDEEDYTNTPYTDYGEFDEADQEETDSNYFQHGRFFGVSFGTGFEGVTGDRGLLWQGGFPLVDFKVHYWFDFHFAMDLGLTYSYHYFDTSTGLGGHVDVSLVRIGMDLKYYFDTKNLSAPITFANPYLLVGGGAYTKTQSSFTSGSNDYDTGLGVDAGAGLEFELNPKKTYFEVEGKVHMVGFKDTYTSIYNTSAQPGGPIPDLTGAFFTLTASLLFTW